MRSYEFLVELGNRILKYTGQNGVYGTLPDAPYNIVVTFAGSSSRLEIIFSVNDELEITNSGDQYTILSTVLNIIRNKLEENIKPTHQFIMFSASADEPSRVKLYKRAASLITNILSDEWEYQGVVDQSHFSEYWFMWNRK